ncbi:hypothetical protein BpHYR1_054493 [Brachionus plicatilis]|uniref:Uncharacterized protein n=1 Tax=Brachionus plicatilis TaxID=10195 RepID=A0A3M7S7W7_BRAPC|nr:hypothetical protein BpHYR1_054493 [Brachionus plicatilis]
MKKMPFFLKTIFLIILLFKIISRKLNKKNEFSFVGSIANLIKRVGVLLIHRALNCLVNFERLAKTRAHLAMKIHHHPDANKIQQNGSTKINLFRNPTSLVERNR